MYNNDVGGILRVGRRGFKVWAEEWAEVWAEEWAEVWAEEWVDEWVSLI
jgi:hypothetical protein